MTAAAIALLAGASPARADCPAPPLGDPSDMVVSFLKTNGTQAAAGSLFAAPVKQGMLVYDSAANQLKYCDGTNWKALVDSGAASGTLAGLSDVDISGASDGKILVFDNSAGRWVIGNAPATGAAGTASEVQFRNNSTGAFDADSAFRYDKANHRLTISANPAALSVGPFTNTVLHLSDVDGTAPRLLLDVFGGGSATAANVSLRAAGGTAASPAALANEDILGQLTFTGYDGTAYAGARAAIRGTATEAWTSSANGADLRFHVTPNGTVDVIEAMRIANDGKVGIGTATPAYPLDVEGVISATSSGEWPFRAYGSNINATGRNHFLSLRSHGGGGAVISGDTLGGIAMGGKYDSTNYAYGWNGGAEISAYATENWSASGRGANLTFATVPNGAALSVERMRITNAGNIGIGTSAPAYRLDVAGAINGTSVLVNGVPVASSTDTYWSPGGAGKIYYSGGAVGVGTANPTLGMLQVTAGGQTLALEGTTHSYMAWYPCGAAAGRKAWMGFGNTGVTDLSITNEDTGGIGLQVGATPSVFIAHSGNVGIGTVSPEFLLHVASDSSTVAAIASAAATSTGPALGFRKSRGTPASPVAVSAGDEIGRIDFNGYNDAWRTSAKITAFAENGYGATGADAPGSLVFSTAPDGSASAQPRLTISPGGFVGIGTTTPAQLLTITGSSPSLLLKDSAATFGTWLSSGTSGSVYTQNINPFNGNLDDTSKPGWSAGFGGTVYQIQYASPGSNPRTLSTLVTVTGTGKVGIGTQTPQKQLDVTGGGAFGTSNFPGSAYVQGNLFVSANTAGAPATSGTSQANLALRVTNPGGSTLDTGVYGNGTFWQQVTNVTNLSNQYALALNPNGGNVGIGTASPNSKLDVAGGIIAREGTLFSSLTTPEGGALSLVNPTKTGALASEWKLYNMTGTYGNGLSFWRYYASGTNAGAAMFISDAGNISMGLGTTTASYALQVGGAVAGGSAYVNTSDLRLKKDIAPIPYGLADVMKLRPVAFQWKNQQPDWAKGRKIGLIAQEVEPVIPEVVSTAHDRMGTKSIAYGDLTPVLIHATQELKADNDNLRATMQAQIDDQTMQIRALRNEIRSLSAAVAARAVKPSTSEGH